MKQLDEHKDALLTGFINKRHHQYEEPERKGTPRGEPIGYSQVKFLATLLVMTSMNKKEIADYLGISFTLMRKWSSEKPFKAMVERNINDFISVFRQQLEVRCGERRKLQQGWLKNNSMDYISDNDPPDIDYAEFADATLFGEPLVTALISDWGIPLKPIGPEEDSQYEAGEVIMLMVASLDNPSTELLGLTKRVVQFYASKVISSSLARIKYNFMDPDLDDGHIDEMMMLISSFKRRTELLMKFIFVDEMFSKV